MRLYCHTDDTCIFKNVFANVDEKILKLTCLSTKYLWEKPSRYVIGCRYARTLSVTTHGRWRKYWFQNTITSSSYFALDTNSILFWWYRVSSELLTQILSRQRITLGKHNKYDPCPVCYDTHVLCRTLNR